MLQCRAIVGLNGNTFAGDNAIAPAPIPAKSIIGALSAFFRHGKRALQELLCGGAVCHVLKTIHTNGTQAQLIQNITVAGINAAIAFNHKLD